MPQYITATEAAALTGKSTATISRLCTKHSGSHYLKKHGRSWLIDKDWLLHEIAPEITVQKPETAPQEPKKEEQQAPEIASVITQLHSQIEELKQDKRFLQQQVNNLQERQREQNYLMGNMQKQLQAYKQPEPTAPANKEMDPNWKYLIWFAGILFALIAIAAYLKASM